MRGFFPMSGNARAPVGLFPPRSLSSFPVALEVGVVLPFVRHLARELLQIFPDYAATSASFSKR